MKLFGLNISVHRDPPRTVAKDATQYALSAGLWPDDGPMGTIMSNAYEQVTWVYRAVNALAEQVSNIPFRFSTTSSAGEELITTGPLVGFYGRPHPEMNKSPGKVAFKFCPLPWPRLISNPT